MEAQNRRTSTHFPFRFYLCRLLPSTLLLTALISFVVASAWAQAPLKVEWKEGHLSVTAESAPLAQILQEIASQTGMKARGREGLQEEVPMRFVDRSLRIDLQQLPVHVNYFLLERTIPQRGTQPALVAGPRTAGGSASRGGSQ